MVELTTTMIALIVAGVLVALALFIFWAILLTALCATGVPPPPEDDIEVGKHLTDAPLGEDVHSIQTYTPHPLDESTENLKAALDEPETQNGIPVVEYQYTPEQEEYMKNNTGRYLVQALHDFAGNKDQYQLTFETNDLIWVVDSHPEEDWWIGEMCVGGEKGYFPTNYVQVLKRTIKTSTKQTQKIADISSKLNL